MFIPAATALKNLVYRIIPTPGQAFHGSVTLTTFFSIFPISSFFLSFLLPTSCLAGNRKKCFVQQISTFDQLWEKDRVVITDDRTHDHWQWAVLELLSLWWCFPNMCNDRLPVLYMSGQYNDGRTDHRDSWVTCCPALLWSLTSVCFWSIGLMESGSQRMAVIPELQSETYQLTG